MAAAAIVELTTYYWGGTRWRYRLEDEEGATVHTGEPRALKTEAMDDRAELLRRAGEWRRKLQAGYADGDVDDAPIFRVALRADYDTRDRVPSTSSVT